MKFLKTAAASILAGSMLFAGCSSAPKPVSADDAPSELLKKAAAITNESSSEEVIEVLQGMIEATAEGYDDRMILSEKASGTSIDPQAETLASLKSDMKSYDLRYGTDTDFYQLYEQESSSTDPVYGLMDSGKSGLTTVYASLAGGSTFGNPSAQMSVDSIVDQPDELSDDQDMKEYVRSSVVYPFYTMLGSTLVLQPAATPEYYNFELTEKGGKYIWTISIRDQEEYNSVLDETFETYYGHSRLDLKGDGTLVVDTYAISQISLEITTDENGCISKIENKNRSTVSQGDTELTLSSNDTVNVSQADESWGAFFENFFERVKDGSLKENDTFTLNKVVNDSDAKDDASSEEKSDSKSSDESSAASESSRDSQKSSQEKTDSSKQTSEDESEKK